MTRTMTDCKNDKSDADDDHYYSLIGYNQNDC